MQRFAPYLPGSSVTATSVWRRSRPTVLRVLLLMVAFLGLGCTAPSNTAGAPPLDVPPVESGDSTVGEVETPPGVDLSLAQQLPITAKTVLGGEEIFLEVAATPSQQALGLMYRDALPDDRGMVFPMTRPRPVSFWMKNVPVPLDMVFIYQGEIVAIAAEVPPCTAEPCPTYGPANQLVDHVIELRAGRAAELGLAAGDSVAVVPLDDGEP